MKFIVLAISFAFLCSECVAKDDYSVIYAGWERLEKIDASEGVYNIACNYEMPTVENIPKEIKRSYMITKSNNQALLSTPKSAFGYNSKYAFTAYKNKDNEQPGWMMFFADVAPINENKTFWRTLQSVHTVHYFYPLSGFFNQSLPRAVEKGYIKITGTVDALAGTYRFEYFTDKEGVITLDAHGLMTLDPAKDFLLVRAEAQLENPKTTMVFTRSAQFSSTRLISCDSSYRETTTGKHVYVEKYDIATRYTGPVLDDKVFTLSDYGLPEPEGVVWEKPTPPWVWFAIAAGVLVIVALSMRWLQRRSTARAAT